MYASPEDFKLHYQSLESSELEQIDNVTAIPNNRLLQALKSAYGEINSIIGGRYSLPFRVNVPYLKWANIVIARKNLDSFDEREKTRKDYEDIIARLTNVGDGKGYLIDENGVALIPLTDEYKGKIYTGNRKATLPNFGHYCNPIVLEENADKFYY